MELDRYDGVDAFLAAAGAFLEAREAEHNLLFGICGALRAAPEAFEQAPYLVAVTDAGEVVAAAIRTPPQNLVLSMTDVPAAAELILDDALATLPDLPGLLAPSALAGRCAQRVSVRTGRGHELAMAERIFRLTHVRPPSGVPGRMRSAEAADRQLLRDWLIAFVNEAVPGEDLSGLDAAVDRWIRRVGRTMYLWEDGEEAVSMAGAGGETPNGIRIGPVYTPPERRGRGYASALTAAVSQVQLDRGRHFCFLFTDLANPTSNRIYQAIGYEPVIDVDQYRFDPPS